MCRMRATACWILTVALSTPLAVWAQELPERSFLVKLKYEKGDLPRSMSTNCIAVFADGRYHFERRSDFPLDSKPQIFEDLLPASDLNSLLDEPELRELKGI
jgi:hypothetical protein